MARVSQLQEPIGDDPRPLFIRLLKGDSFNPVILLRTRPDAANPNGIPINLTAYTFAAKAYKYTANVPDGPLPSISNYSPVAGDSGSNIAVIKADQTLPSGLGKIRLQIPANLISQDIPINVTENVPVLVVYIRKEDNANPPNIVTKRIVIAYHTGF